MTQQTDPLPPEPPPVRLLAGGSALLLVAALIALAGLVLLMLGEMLSIVLFIAAVGLLLFAQARLKHATRRRGGTT